MVQLGRCIATLLIVLLNACASLPPQAGRTETHALQNTADTRLGAAFAPSERAHPASDAFHLLPAAMDALVARIILMEATDRALDMQYYIWHDDVTGRALAAAMLRAADRGVQVRLLIDDLGTNADDRVLLAIASHPNVEIRLFNPVASRSFKTLGSALEFFRVNRRMHNKAMIADNQGAILGGRNIGDEYFGASTTVSFGDLDVLVHGPVVREVSTAFDEYWNSEAAYPIERLMGRSAESDALTGYRAKLEADMAIDLDTPYFRQAKERLIVAIDRRDAEYSWGKATLLYDDPSKITRAPADAEGHLVSRFRALNLQPEREMLIVSPYFVPLDRGVEWLRGMTARGVRVAVLTNSLSATDVAAVHAGYERYREDLLDAGVRLYELKSIATDKPTEKKSTFGSSKASLHAKTYVFDRKGIFIGSMNLDPRSVELNTEIGVYCESETAAGQVVDGINANLDSVAWRLELRTDANGTVTELEREPDVSAWRRASIWFLGLLPIESQL